MLPPELGEQILETYWNRINVYLNPEPWKDLYTDQLSRYLTKYTIFYHQEDTVWSEEVQSLLDSLYGTYDPQLDFTDRSRSEWRAPRPFGGITPCPLIDTR